MARLRDIIYHLSPLVLCNLIAQIYSACTCIRVCPTRIHQSHSVLPPPVPDWPPLLHACAPAAALPPRPAPHCSERRHAVAIGHAAQEQQPRALLRSETTIQKRHFKGPVLLPAACHSLLYPLLTFPPLSHKIIPIPAHILSHLLYILHMKVYVCLS